VSELQLYPYLPLVLIFLTAGFTQGVSGFGAGLLAMPLLTMFLDLEVAVPLCMLNGLLITSFLSFQLKQHIDWQKIRPLFIGCIPGIFLGVYLLKGLDGSILKIFLGLLLINYSLYRLFGPAPRTGINRLWAYPAGLATGIIGGAFSAGGPPTIIYVSMTGWQKDEIKATLSIFFFTTGVVTSTAHAINGLITSQVMIYFAVSCIFTITGVALGSHFYQRIKQESYIKIILILLILMGLMMVSTAVFGLL